MIKNKISGIIAFGILGIMFLIMFGSSWNDSATFDEVAHIPAGYSYLTQKDYRLNPEHPPLAKDIATLPLLFLDLKFPINNSAWTNDINGQWDMGRIFLYESGNDADQILRYSRFPIMILALILGWMIFKQTTKRYGKKVGLLALFFYSFSPTIIAHSRYVTTDTITTFGVFLALATFANFLANQTRKNLIIAGLAFGFAQLCKFSLITLGPLYLVLAIIWAFVNRDAQKTFIKLALEIIGKTILIFTTGVILIWGVYQYHVWNYPPAHQIKTTEAIVGSFPVKEIMKATVWSADKPILQPLGEYFFGLMMMTQRASGGNANYYLGALYGKGNPSYFPLLYLVKETLAFHILTLLAIIFFIRRKFWKTDKTIPDWIRENFWLFTGVAFIIMYSIMSITGNLNIGIRHIMPILPFIYIIVARQIIKWFENVSFFKRTFITIILVIFLSWGILSTLFATPYYLSYYNALSGGIKNGYKIATDSNYDWGQDLKRLKDWAGKNLPADKKIALDYFGGGNLKYYFGDKVEGWWSSRGNPKDAGIEWLAISANTLTSALADTTPGFERKNEDTYQWLRDKEPVARVGSSIFIYKF